MLVLLVFFFSSRRRHTRLVSDWSSDVCSSDLTTDCSGRSRRTNKRPRESPPGGETGGLRVESRRQGFGRRSEERRVGKECRARRWRGHEKKRRRERTRARGADEREVERIAGSG